MTYRERFEEIYEQRKDELGLTGLDLGPSIKVKDVFVEWALQRHLRLRARDKKWLDRHEEVLQKLPPAQKYFAAVCLALKKCDGTDFYTGETLDWEITLFNFLKKGKKGENKNEDEENEAEKRRERVTFDHVNGRDLEKADEKKEAEAEKRRKRVTFDHVNGRNLKKLEFVICAGKTNDAKNDLSEEEFFNLCNKVVETHNKRRKSSAR